MDSNSSSEEGVSAAARARPRFKFWTLSTVISCATAPNGKNASKTLGVIFMIVRQSQIKLSCETKSNKSEVCAPRLQHLHEDAEMNERESFTHPGSFRERL
mmetsp:Transcript_14344/g.28934  ORF Transcript_14344/g.28934 Transcript_14344/m.28934 type:complete len:101 (-) Transcript_14344:1-303(-)